MKKIVIGVLTMLAIAGSSLFAGDVNEINSSKQNVKKEHKKEKKSGHKVKSMKKETNKTVETNKTK